MLNRFKPFLIGLAGAIVGFVVAGSLYVLVVTARNDHQAIQALLTWANAVEAERQAARKSVETIPTTPKDK